MNAAPTDQSARQTMCQLSPKVRVDHLRCLYRAECRALACTGIYKASPGCCAQESRDLLWRLHVLCWASCQLSMMHVRAQQTHQRQCCCCHNCSNLLAMLLQAPAPGSHAPD